jgi:SAM-dependent MidA family methyltransferase
MNTGNPDLIRFICAEIEKQGPQSFAWFMQLALYHPEHGYYSSGHCTIGRQGDYFSNVSVGSVFGQLLAAQFAEIWERLGKPGRRGDIDDFVITEQGAHDGQFACDVLDSVQKRAPKFFAALRYRIVEPFPVLQERQAQTLRPFREKIEWRDSLQPFTGIHFSNELLDAMPVRLIADGREKLVGLDGDRFVFVERPVNDETFNHAALEWIDEVAANLERGYVITLDYGRLENEFQENVQVRARHRILDSPFEQIGQADITMPVDWRSIVLRAQANGLHVVGFTDQHHFLTGIISEFGNGGSPEAPADDWGQSLVPGSCKAKRELQTLLHPEMLGRAFQVLALEKNLSAGMPQLAGFRFAREPRSSSK